MVHRKKKRTSIGLAVCHGWKGTPMGSSNPVVVKLSTPEYQKIIVEASDGLRYYADLSSLSRVYCFPKNKTEWNQVSADSFGTALIWTSRFEAHIDQIIGLAYKTEKVSQAA
jgi:hypothetical protein